MSENNDPSEAMILVIEVSNPTACEQAAFVALADRDGVMIDHEPLHAGGRDDLHPAIKRVTDRCGVKPMQIGRVAVSVGPGGYTGLRVAVAAGKLIAECVGAQVVSMPTAQVVARSVCEGLAKPLGIALASKGETCHLTIETEAGTFVDSGMLRAEGLETLGLRALVADGHLPTLIRDEAKRVGLEVLPVEFSPGAACRLAAEVEPTGPDGLCVKYAREPDAVTQWRVLHPDR